MNDMERRKFEDAFKNAFQDAEISPGENVWTNVELDLARAEGGKMKKRVLFYQLLAAASITFAVCVVGTGYYQLAKGREELTALKGNVGVAEDKSGLNQAIAGTDASYSKKVNDTNDTSDTENNSQTKAAEVLNSFNQSDAYAVNNNAKVDAAKLKARSNEFQSGSKNTYSENDRASHHTNDVNADRDLAVANVTPESGSASGQDILSGSRKLTALYVYEPKNPITISHAVMENEPDAVAVMFARLSDREQELASGEEKRKVMSKEKIWTSVGFSAGNFSSLNPEVSSSNPALGLASNNKAATNQAKASGIAYSMGVSFGTRVTNRWVIQGGVNYMTQVSDYTTTVAVSSMDLNYFKPASINEFRDASDEKYVPTEPYTVNNSLRYISLPVQAGYLLIDRQFGVQMNAGVSTDMFLQNTIDPEGSLEKTTQGRGADSPYRSVNFSGLVGSEVTYRFADRYRLSLNPGIRYPFRSIYKDEAGVTSTPITFDIGLRFRYIFK